MREGGLGQKPRPAWSGDGLGQKPRTAERALLAAILLAFTGLALWYTVTIPLGEAPDEVPHFTYVRYIVRHGALPATEEEHEAFQPPLYYALGAALTFWIEDAPGVPFAIRANADYDVADPRSPKNLLLHSAAEAWPYRGWALAWHVLRLLSIALGAVTVWAVYRLGRVLFPDQAAVPLAMAALTALTPQFLFLSAVVNNDNAAVALSALILWRVAALLHQGDAARLPWESLGLGLLLGLGILSKVSVGGLVPVVGAAVLISCLRVPRHCEERSDEAISGERSGGASPLLLAVRCLALAGAAVVAVAGWYFLRNWLVHGDPLGWSFVLKVNALREGPLTPEVLRWLAVGIFRSFWLGWIGIVFDEPIYWALAGVCLAGAAGFAAWLVRRWRHIPAAARWTLALLGLSTAITLASLVQWTATVLGTDQGRLIYPSLPALMLVLAAGWAWWGRGAGRAWLLGGLCAGMLFLAILAPIRYIAPVHAPAPVATEAELAAARPLGVTWGERVRLLGYRLETASVAPGEKLILRLYWQGIAPTEPDWMALIRLAGPDGTELAKTDGSPTAGRDTTDRWAPGVPLASRHLLPVPEWALPGEYSLTIALHPFGAWAWIPAIGPDGAIIGDQLLLPETVRVAAP